jgi:hypothetical protein
MLRDYPLGRLVVKRVRHCLHGGCVDHQSTIQYGELGILAGTSIGRTKKRPGGAGKRAAVKPHRSTKQPISLKSERWYATTARYMGIARDGPAPAGTGGRNLGLLHGLERHRRT